MKDRQTDRERYIYENTNDREREREIRKYE